MKKKRKINMKLLFSGPAPNSPHLSAANAGNAPSPAMTASTCSNASSQLWKTRLTNIKNSFLGSPRFHRRKLQGNDFEEYDSNVEFN